MTSGAKFGISVIDSFNVRPEWAKSDNELANYIILATFVVSFSGSLARKMSSLRYFSFITSLISLGVGLVVSGLQGRHLPDAFYQRILQESTRSGVSWTTDQQLDFWRLLSRSLLDEQPVLRRHCHERARQPDKKETKHGRPQSCSWSSGER